MTSSTFLSESEAAIGSAASSIPSHNAFRSSRRGKPHRADTAAGTLPQMYRIRSPDLCPRLEPFPLVLWSPVLRNFPKLLYSCIGIHEISLGSCIRCKPLVRQCRHKGKVLVLPEISNHHTLDESTASLCISAASLPTRSQQAQQAQSALYRRPI